MLSHPGHSEDSFHRGEEQVQQPDCHQPWNGGPQSRSVEGYIDISIQHKHLSLSPNVAAFGEDHSTTLRSFFNFLLILHNCS